MATSGNNLLMNNGSQQTQQSQQSQQAQQQQSQQQQVQQQQQSQTQDGSPAEDSKDSIQYAITSETISLLCYCKFSNFVCKPSFPRSHGRQQRRPADGPVADSRTGTPTHPTFATSAAASANRQRRPSSSASSSRIDRQCILYSFDASIENIFNPFFTCRETI